MFTIARKHGNMSRKQKSLSLSTYRKQRQQGVEQGYTFSKPFPSDLLHLERLCVFKIP